jgi:hypothetical protein
LSCISESYEILLRGSGGIFGGELSDERTRLETEDRGGILVNISDADYGVYTHGYILMDECRVRLKGKQAEQDKWRYETN